MRNYLLAAVAAAALTTPAMARDDSVYVGVDAGVMLVELIAYAADNLSYRQDAVATEAYLATARRRVANASGSRTRTARLSSVFGVGKDSNIVTASLKAIISATNRVAADVELGRGLHLELTETAVIGDELQAASMLARRENAAARQLTKNIGGVSAHSVSCGRAGIR
mgnify:CR=1 FL=1